MRLLHVNKFLYRRGGAEAYMEDLADLQAAAGHEVAFFGMAHPSNTHLEYAEHFPSHIELEPPPAGAMGKARGVARMLYSTSARRGMEAVLDRFQPDVVHLHNIYHQLSPSILRPVARRDVPAVMTLHDYKLACPTYRFLDHGNVCEACLGGRFHNAVLRRCKDGSIGASAVAATELFVHTLMRSYGAVDRFICPSEFLAGRMRAAGVFPSRLRHVPHFIDVDHVQPREASGSGALVAGRLSPEKGVDVAIRATGRLEGARLDIAGTGPEEAALRRLAGEVAPGRVHFLGLLDKAAMQARMRDAAVVVVPSRWYENQPMVVLEAMAMGVPVVATRLGGLPELVVPGVTGLLVDADDPEGLAGAMRSYLEDAAAGMAVTAPARRRIVEEFSPAVHLRRVHEVYREAGVPAATAAA